MKRNIIVAVLIATTLPLTGQESFKSYEPTGEIYREGWIDLNKNGKKDIYEDSSQKIDKRIDDLLSQMNIEEKTCQMVTLYGYGRILKDDLPTEEWKSRLWKDGVGAIDEHLNGFRNWRLAPSDNQYVWPASRHTWAMNEVQRFFIEQTRLGIPVDFTNEGIRGVESLRSTNFPTQLGLGHTWDRDLVRRIGAVTGVEARALGYTNVYSPILDVARDQRWGRFEESYGESPYLVAELGIQMARGIQEDGGAAATAKHFLAYSANKGAREGLARTDPQISPREVEMVHAYPFKRVIREAGLKGIMCAYNDYDGIPIEGSRYWLTERLRGEMGFRGYVVSDSDAVEYLHSKHSTAANMKESVLQSVLAGLNVRCTFRSPDSYVLPLRELVEEGAIPMEVIDSRVRDILKVKFELGLFDSPYVKNLEESDRIVGSEAHQELALRASRESIVLLKNEGGLLPLERGKVRKIAVCGPNAAEESYAKTHYGPLDANVISVLEGLQELSGAEILYTKGCELVDENWPESEIFDFPLTSEEQAEIDKAVANARKADLSVVVLGGGIRTCGENKSRTSIDLPGRQEILLKAVCAVGKPVILILINGRPLSINWADANVPAILEAWYPGSFGGQALTEIIFGDCNPSGKLTCTFPRTVGQIPFNFPCKPNAQIGGDTKPGPDGGQSRINTALYHFGFGLSYTTFEYSDLQVTTSSPSDKVPAKASLTVTNTGNREGDEIVQLYIRDVLSSVTTYEKRLIGFERVHLAPGQSRRIDFSIRKDAFELLDRNSRWTIEPGDFRIMAGASSEDIRLEKTVTFLPQEPKAQDGFRKINPILEGAPVHGTGWKELTSGYVRLPEHARGKVRDAVWKLSRNSSGLSIVFRSNTKSIKVDMKLGERMQMYHMQSTGVSGIDLFAIDKAGNEHWCAPKFSASIWEQSDKESGTKETMVSYNYERLDYDGNETYEYHLYLPLYNSVKNLELTVEKDCFFEFAALKEEKPVVVYGTSIAQGACASRPGMAWTNILERESGLPFVNLGFSGNGKMEKEMFELLDEIDAGAYIIDCLPNINLNDDFEARLEEGLKLLRRKHSCPIVLVEHSGYTNDRTNHNRLYANELNTRQENLFKKLRRQGFKNLHYVTREQIGWNNDSMVEGVHPNDHGMKQQADAVLKVLRKAL